jgi:NAD-dependent dihydropyrimidine dehydrogenase PreA subunit
MKRQIVTIEESLCDGCGDCVTACSEGALEIIDGKAKLVKENFCDGFGDCIGECPTGALVIEEREVEAFDEIATKQHLMKIQGFEAVRRMEAAQMKHKAPAQPQMAHQPMAHQPMPHQPMAQPAMAHQPMAHHHGGGGGGCPGSAMRQMNNEAQAAPVSSGMPDKVNQSELTQWPVQIHLVQPGAPFFRNKELVIMNTCGAISSADVHWRYLRGRSVVVGCPKLDDTSNYAAKLGMILRDPSIPRVIIVRMEVPCCGGLTQIAEQAVRLSGRDDLILQEDTIKVDGTIMADTLTPVM